MAKKAARVVNQGAGFDKEIIPSAAAAKYADACSLLWLSVSAALLVIEIARKRTAKPKKPTTGSGRGNPATLRTGEGGPQDWIFKVSFLTSLDWLLPKTPDSPDREAVQSKSAEVLNQGIGSVTTVQE